MNISVRIIDFYKTLLLSRAKITTAKNLASQLQFSNTRVSDSRVRELVSRLPPERPSKMGVTTEVVTKRTFTETSVKRVTKNETKPKVEEVVLVKAGGPLGLSIIGGSDHSCVPFGTGEPGIFISKVRGLVPCVTRLL